MTDYAPRRSPDLNQVYSTTSLPISQYTHGSMDYVHSNSHIQYPQMASAYPSYSQPFLPGQPTSWVPVSSRQLNMSPYSTQSARNVTLPSQPRTLSHAAYYSASLQSQPHLHQSHHYSISHETSLLETEDQDSLNQDTKKSEPINPPLDGYPNVEDFDRLMSDYVRNLSPKKQDKALIHAKRAANIKAVLIDKKTTQVESAQFRFWVKKMFTLQPEDSNVPAAKRKICHDHKPVAIREKLFKILTQAHKQCQHGGRDKTSAQVRRVYSWVPKELISRFVKICPTCQTRRGTGRASTQDDDKDDGASPDDGCDDLASPQTYRESTNRWMAEFQQSDKLRDQAPKLENTAPNIDVHNSVSFSEPLSPHTKSPERMAASGYASMDSASVMEVDHPSYYQQGISGYHGYQSQDMAYRYKHGRPHKHERRY